MTYIADPLSRAQLRLYANTIRKSLGLDQTLWFPVEKFLELIPILIGDEDFYFQSVDDCELPVNTHAEYNYDLNCICIKRSVYDGACSGHGRDRMTIVHEISHLLLLKHSGVKLYRSFEAAVPCYRDPEWQAKCLAGELMVPSHLVHGMTPIEIAKTCGVSVAAAQVQLRSIK